MNTQLIPIYLSIQMNDVNLVIITNFQTIPTFVWQNEKKKTSMTDLWFISTEHWKSGKFSISDWKLLPVHPELRAVTFQLLKFVLFIYSAVFSARTEKNETPISHTRIPRFCLWAINNKHFERFSQTNWIFFRQIFWIWLLQLQ